MTGSLSITATNTQDGIKYDVFLSFRGEDTRKNFTAHLHTALTQSGIDAYIDTRLDGGERIETLYSKITECLVTVVIFSPKYADSGWCLEELVKVVECMETKRMRVLPVFVGVEPIHVREQSGEFGNGFKRGLDKCKDKEMEKTWKRAMVEIANIRRSEWDPDGISEEQILGETLCSFHRSEDQIVGDVVSAIEKILDQMSANDLEDGFIGSERILKVESLLRIDSKEGVHSVGISGASGIGKTSIARTVFYRSSGDFDAHCFLGNIAEKSRREGLDSLQKVMITQLLGPENSRAGLHILSANIRRKLKRKRVLIVLDDVGTARQLKTLFGNSDIYGPGSRLIVTSKDIQVLKSGCIDIYKVEKLNDREAFQLFKFHAFKQEQPTGEFIELSKKVVAYAKGLPSVLENWGCDLFGKSIKEWESELAKLQETLGLETTTADEVEEMGS